MWALKRISVAVGMPMSSSYFRRSRPSPNFETEYFSKRSRMRVRSVVPHHTDKAYRVGDRAVLVTADDRTLGGKAP